MQEGNRGNREPYDARGPGKEQEKKQGERRRFALLLLCYLGIIAATVWAEWESWNIPMGDGRINRFLIFRFFTNDSNILLALSCLAALPGTIRALRGGKGPGRGIHVLRFMATVSVALTFWTVVLFLGPLFGYGAMYRGEDGYLHAWGPLLAFVLWVFFERGERMGWREVLLSGLPMLCYGSVYAYEVVFARNWGDFYGLVGTGHWAVTFGGMLLATLALGLLHAALHNRFALGRKRAEKD